MRASESFLVVEGTGVDWGAPARHLLALASEADWRGEAPLEPATALGIASGTAGASVRVAVLSAAGGPFPVRIASRASIEELPGAPLCPLPRALLGPRAAVFEAVVFEARSRPLLIVNPERLAARRPSSAASSPTPSPEGGAAT